MAIGTGTDEGLRVVKLATDVTVARSSIHGLSFHVVRLTRMTRRSVTIRT